MGDTRSAGKARRGAGEQKMAGTRPAVIGGQHGSGGCGDGGHGQESPAEGTGSAATAAAAAEYGSADSCGRSGRAAGRGKYRGCRIQRAPEREASHEAEVQVDRANVLVCWWSMASGGKELGSDARSAGGDTQRGVVRVVNGQR